MAYTYVPPSSAPSLKKSLDGSTIGSLADFQVTKSAVPIDPRDSSGQIPTMTATLTNTGVSARSLIDEDVVLNDWTGNETSARVVSVQANSNSGLTNIDTSTVFQRLNTEQTTYPIQTGAGWSSVPGALEQWTLMCGVTYWRNPGNLLQCIPNGNPGTIGLITDSIQAFSDSGPVSSGTRQTYRPTVESYTAPIEVNPSQGVIIGAAFLAGYTLSEFRIQARDKTQERDITYIVRRNGDTYSVREGFFGGAETVLLSGVHADQTTYYQMVYVKITANAAAGKVDITLRIIEKGDYNNAGPSEDIVTDFTATGVTSSLRNRPLPWRVELGYESTLLTTQNPGSPSQYFMSEGTTLPQSFPVEQVQYMGPTSIAGEDVYAGWPDHIPGFTGNVWEKLKEFCSLTEIDIIFSTDGILFQSRLATVKDDYGVAIPALNLSKGNVSEHVENRDVAKAVEVVYHEFDTAVTDFNNNEMWRATQVYSLNQGELKEEIVQTNSTFFKLHDPVPVNGVPVPYTSTYGSYVITGDDGYIVDPDWWDDNGGYIRVTQTGVAGEIKIIMKAPNVDSIRAPYRVSEGVADRPALYIFGSGINMGEPKTLRVLTGAADAAQDVGVKYEAPFVTNKGIAYNAGFKLAEVFGTATSSISFEVPKTTLAKEVDFGTEYSSIPDGARVYYQGSHYRITDSTLTPSGITVGKAAEYTTVSALTESLGTSATVADWNNLHAGETLKEATLSPLTNYIS